jgi:hypothetical protein
MPPEVPKIPNVKVSQPTNLHVIPRPLLKPVVTPVKVTFEASTAKLGARVETTGIKEGKVVRNSSGQALVARVDHAKRGGLVWGEPTPDEVARAEEGYAKSLENKWTGGAAQGGSVIPLSKNDRYVAPAGETVNLRGPTPDGRAYRPFAPLRRTAP